MNAEFDTVAEAERRARRRLPKPILSSLLGGREQGLSLRDNYTAFGELALMPNAFDKPATIDPSTSFLGQPLSFPAIVSPLGALGLHPDGELAIAQAAARIGISMAVSSFASRSVTEIGQVTQNLHFQLYWLGSRADIEARLERAAAAGAKGLILTVDLSRSAPRRDWATPSALPSRWTLGSLIRHGPSGVSRPAWLLRYLRRGSLPGLTVPNLAGVDGHRPTFTQALNMMRLATPPTRADVAWLREKWNGPLMIKGINTLRDARIAADLGADAIGLSNHGGNHLDGTVAAIRYLPAVVEALQGRLPVTIDGGVRRGTDVVKAIAVGASVVLLGRAVAYGLAAGGEEGVYRVLEIVRSGVVEAMEAIGAGCLADIARSDAIVRRNDFFVVPPR